jgi:hypothetical protein
MGLLDEIKALGEVKGSTFTPKPAKRSGSNARKQRVEATAEAPIEIKAAKPKREDAPDRCPDALRVFVFERDGFACLMCGKNAAEDKAKLEADRIVPGAAQGKYTEENTCVLCRDCNRAKGAKRLSLLATIIRRHRANLEGKPNRTWPGAVI